MKLDDERLQILTKAAEDREREVMYHQINIENYRLALSEIEASYKGDAEMSGFADNLRSLLASSVFEQKKELVMLKVIKKQLGC